MPALGQEDFSGGIFRGRRAPKNTVYDALNALISDEGEMFRRGGSEYKSGSDAGSALLSLWDGQLTAGQRTVFHDGGILYTLSSNDSSVTSLVSTDIDATVRPVEIGGLLFMQTRTTGTPRDLAYAGTRKSASYTTGTISTTAGSATVTGSGTTWTSNVDAGMLLAGSGGGLIGVVKSVETNTSLTLTRPAVSTVAGSSYTAEVVHLGPMSAGATSLGGKDIRCYAVAGTRLLRVTDTNRVYFSVPLDSASFYSQAATSTVAPVADTTTDYHELPQAAFITGAIGLGDTAVLFTTNGVWTIDNIALDAVDAFGNIQHQVRQVSKDLILWGDAGLAAQRNALIVPAIDDVYAFAPGVDPAPLSVGLRPLYREYVEAGYKPGIATVYRGHYILPILESDNDVVDTLVCRLDRGPAWTRWANGASGRAYAVRVGSTTREPKLLGLDGLRVSELTGTFDPDSTRKDDADGTDHALTVTTNDYPLGPGLQKGHCIRVRANYSLVDAASDNPTTVMQWSRGPEGSSFTTVTATRGGGESDGTEYSSWPINKAAEFIRFKWATSGAATSAVLRKIEVLFRPYGKQ